MSFRCCQGESAGCDFLTIVIDEDMIKAQEYVALSVELVGLHGSADKGLLCHASVSFLAS